MSSYKPRKRKAPHLATVYNSHSNAHLIISQKGGPKPAFPLVAFLWPARSAVSQWVVLPAILMIAALFRWAVGLWGYSGYGNPPMHGDFEAQRHWIEITNHLPLPQWYFYDLQYWGLDYPPFTAYHSWVMGKIGSMINYSWFALDSSRGCETPSLKLFMRVSVIFSEYLVYVPAVAILLRRYVRRHSIPTWFSYVAMSAILFQPASILIDHGHFQYNTVMLGFTVAAIESIEAERHLWACVFFVAALGFKQMALYYSPVIFAYLLGRCFSPRVRIGRLLSIALVTLISFALMFVPFVLFAGKGATTKGLPPPAILSSLPVTIGRESIFYPIALQLAQVTHRVFPFARGLFEDKVANFWCAVHTFYKLNRFPANELQRLSLGATALATLPSFLTILIHPRRGLLPYALASCAWAFFLFSFQVHEKSVLLPLLPMTLLLGTGGGLSRTMRAWIGWANILGAVTMYPLLKRDGLAVPYAVLTLLWAYLLGLPPASFLIYSDRQPRLEDDNDSRGDDSVPLFTCLIHLSSYLAMAVWHIGEAKVQPPVDKPDLWLVLNALLGAAGFGIAYLWCTWRLLLLAFSDPTSSGPAKAKADAHNVESKKKR